MYVEEVKKDELCDHPVFKFIREKTLFFIISLVLSLIIMIISDNGNECYMTSCLIDTKTSYNWGGHSTCNLFLQSDRQVYTQMSYDNCIPKRYDSVKCNWSRFHNGPTLDCNTWVFFICDICRHCSIYLIGFSVILRLWCWVNKEEPKKIV